MRLPDACPTSRQQQRFRIGGMLLSVFALVASCRDSVAPPAKLPAPAVAASEDSILLTYIGEARPLSATALRGSAAVSTPFAWEVRGKEVAYVTQAGNVIALEPGEAWVVVVSDSGGRDSTKVVVTQRVARIEITPRSASVQRHRAVRFRAIAYDAGGTPIPDPVITWTSASPAIATIQSDDWALGASEGSTTIRATIGDVSGEATLVVTPAARLRIQPDTIHVGVGHFLEGLPSLGSVMLDSIYAGEITYASASVGNESIATTNPTLHIDKYPTIPEIIGVSAGVTTFVVSHPRYAHDTAMIRVSNARLSFKRFAPTGEVSIGVGQRLHVRVEFTDSLHYPGRILSRLSPVATSLDPSVMRVNSVWTVERGYAHFQLEVEGLSQGQTRLVVSATGHRPDTLIVTVAPAKVSFTQPEGSPIAVTTVGVGHATSVHAARNSTASTSLTVTFTQRHPEVVRLPAQSFPLVPGFQNQSLNIWGLTVGTDTIIMSAPGHEPDTLIVHVVRPSYRLTSLTRHGTVVQRAVVSIAASNASTSAFEWQQVPGTARVTSSNPAVVRPVSDVIAVGPGTLELEFLSVGTATLTFSDPAGVYLPLTSPVITVEPAKIRMVGPRWPSSPTSFLEYSLGMRQTLGYPGGPGATVTPWPDKPATITLRSSNPSIFRPMRTSISLPSENIHTDLIGGDVAGRAWLIAEGVGMTSDSVAVVVSQPLFNIRGALDYPSQERSPISVYEGNEFAVFVEAFDSRGNLNPISEDVSVHFTVSSPEHLQLLSATAVIRAGNHTSTGVVIRAVKAGSAVVRATDPRTASYRYESSAAVITIVPKP